MNRREFVGASLAAACVAAAGSAFADVPPVPHRPGPAPHHPPKPVPPPPHHPPKPVPPPPRMIECPHCHGRGRVKRNWLGFTKECPRCHGHGRIPAPVPPPPKPVPPPPHHPPKPVPPPHGGTHHGAPVGAPPPRR